jgi:nitrogen regulatory protein PII
MKRMELIANHSMEEEIISTLEEKISNFYYTIIPNVHGRGKNSYHMGTATWPEENFMVISYLTDHDALTVEALVEEIKQYFPGEGIKLFFINNNE